jgi:hypothetical protein
MDPIRGWVVMRVFSIGLCLCFFSMVPAFASDQLAPRVVHTVHSARSAVWPLADHNGSGDVLLVSGKKWLLNWDGVLRGGQLPLDLLRDGEVSAGGTHGLSGGLYRRMEPPRLSQFPWFRRYAYLADLPSVPASRFSGETPVLGWVCSSGGFLALIEDRSSHATARSLPVVGLFAPLSAVAGAQNRAGLKVAACVTTDRADSGGLIALVRDQTNGWLWNAWGAFPKQALPFPASHLVAGQSTNEGDSVLSLDSDSGRAFLISIASGHGPDGWYPDQVAELSSGLPLRGPESDPADASRVVARNGQILFARSGQIWLGKLGEQSALEDFPVSVPLLTTFVSWQRLPLVPCEDNNPGGCGLSIGHDGTWVVSGYWGTYVGRSNLFRRMGVPNFSAEGRLLAFSHQSIPGYFAVFGADDADMGYWSEDLDLPQAECTDWGDFGSRHVGRSCPHQSNKTASTYRSGEGVAWLRPGAHPVQTSESVESPLFKDRVGLQVVVVSGQRGFDPKRHLFFEPVVQIGPLIPPGDDALGRQDQMSHLLPRGLNRSRMIPWWMEALGYNQALSLVGDRQPLRRVRIAVLDSGADLGHSDFHPVYPDDEHGGNGWDDDGNGYVDDDVGYDFIDEDATPQDEHGHGSHVTGLAYPNHPLFARSLELLNVRVLDASGRSNTLDIGRGFIYAADRGAEVINASWGGGGRTFFMEEAIAYARSRGSFIVTSAGNDGLSIDSAPPVPVVYPGVLAVGARQISGRRAKFSNYGSERVFTFMPGENIPSLALGGGTVEKSGTSMAAPLFSSFLALSLSYLPVAAGASHVGPDTLARLLDIMCSSPASGARRLAARCREPSLPQTLESVLADSGLQVIRFASRWTAK